MKINNTMINQWKQSYMRAGGEEKISEKHSDLNKFFGYVLKEIGYAGMCSNMVGISFLSHLDASCENIFVVN